MTLTLRIILTGAALVLLYGGGCGRHAQAFDLTDAGAIGAACLLHLGLHEIGHQVVAQEAGATDSKMQFFTQKDGIFCLGLSTCKDLPKESKLSYAAGGERMIGWLFEYGLASYRSKGTMFNKALLLVTGIHFLAYTIRANYLESGNNYCDPDHIRQETGLSKTALLSIVALKAGLNAYRIFNDEVRLIPWIAVDKKSAAVMVGFRF